MDCFNCIYSDCISEVQEDDVSKQLDLEVRLEKKRIKAKNRYERYGATKKGYETRMKAKKKYEKANPNKTALWNFKSRIRREKGRDPSEQECREFLVRRGYITA